MKLNYSLVTRRTFLNAIFGGWAAAFLAGGAWAFIRGAFPTLGKEPDFVILKPEEYMNIPPNSTKPFAWGGTLGSHMECNVVYKPESQRFYCPCHKGWFNAEGVNIEGPPPKPLEFFDYRVEDNKLIVYRKGVKVELPKA
jgi:Rieske Fe-S protein